MPVSWLLALFIAALFAPVKYKKRTLLAGIIGLYFYCTDVLLHPLFKRWEYPMVWYKDIAPTYDAAIVLGGMAAPGKLPDDRTHFPGSPDRLMHALQLYKLGKVKKIIISGGSGELTGKRIPEAQYLANVLLLCHMDTSDILFESQSRNTRENALYSKALIDAHFPKDAKFLLVTSGFHMRRSIGCFQKVGIPVKAFPVNSFSQESGPFVGRLLPDPWIPGKWQIFIHEFVGYLTYLLAGYI